MAAIALDLEHPPAGTRSLGTTLDPHRLEDHIGPHHIIDLHHIQFAGAKIA